jgi:hypothetical protein
MGDLQTEALLPLLQLHLHKGERENNTRQL